MENRTVKKDERRILCSLGEQPFSQLLKQH